MMSGPPSPVVPTVDFDAPGVQHGFLRLPWSRDDSAWGNLMIPIAVAKGGAGPTLLVIGGNHGDEYEGPLAILDTARRLDDMKLHGRVILLPFLNYPAVKAAKRTSPVDGRNMNRIFPGSATGSLSEKIADYVLRGLIPMADAVLDFHSGGRTLDFLPFAASHVLPDKTQEARCDAAVAAFAAPYSVKMLEIDAVGMLDTAVEEAGKTFVTTELGGGGTATATSVKIARRGITNLLHHLGILEGRPEPVATRFLDMPSGDCFTFADTDGMLELTRDLGDLVRAGETIARIWPLDRTGRPPADYRAKLDGLLIARHFPGLAQAGDCLAVVGTVVEEEEQERKAQGGRPSLHPPDISG
jgi:N2-acetyl-L-2,4-diaminobutanoate deacetylase